jgi:hypothetical protein
VNNCMRGDITASRGRPVKTALLLACGLA